MKKILILCLLVFTGCQDTNSNSYDKDKYSEVGDGDPAFKAAFTVLQNRCISCHDHSAWSKYTSSEKWIASGLIVAKNTSASPIIYKIYNFGGGSSNMPLGGSTGIPGSEYQALLDWVEGL